MKSFQAILLSVILLIFLLLLGVSVFFTHEASFKKISNLLLAPLAIEISKVEDINLSLSERSLSVNNIYLHYQGNIAHLHQATFYLGYLGYLSYLGNLNEGEKHHKITLKQLSIEINSTSSSENSQQKTTNLLDLLPEKIIQDYAGVDISLGTLTIHHASYLKQPLVLTNVALTNQINGLRLNLILGLSSIQPNHQADIVINLSRNNEISIKLHLAENDFFNLNLTVTPNETQNQLVLNSKIDFAAANEFLKLVNNYWLHSENIHSLHSKMHFSGQQTIPSSISDLETLYPMLLTGNFTSSIHTNLKLKDLPFEALTIQLNAEANSTYTETAEANSTLTFLGHNAIEAKPNSNHSVFKQNKNLAFLSKHPIIAGIKPNSKINTQNKVFNFSQGFSLSWANKQDPAFAHVTIDTLNGHYASTENFNSNIQYHFNGRWNKNLASQHNNIIQVNKINSQLVIDTSLKDEELRSEINMKVLQKDQAINASYHFQLGNLKSSNKKLNTFISDWDKDLSLLKGSLEIQGTLHSSISASNELSPMHYQFDVKVKNIDVDYDGFIFSNINTTANFVGLDQSLMNTNDFTIHIDKIDAGVDINNFSINAFSRLQLDGDSSIQFSNMQANTLGGKIFTELFLMHLPYSETNTQQKYHAEFAIDLLNMQLSQVLALANNPEIQGKGLLYGKLPVFVDEKSTLIKSGWIKNKNKGTLRYVPNTDSQAMLKQNPQMKLLLDVLGHLNYEQLTGDIELDDSGLMTIQGHLQGVNPDFKKGYPIIFNPRIELDLQDMITSLQISEDISDKVSNRIQEKHLD